MDASSRIVITGGKGFLGRAVMASLQSKNYNNVATFSSNDFDLVSQKDTELMFDELKPDVVIHLAARVGGIGANMQNPGKFCYENLAMGANVIEQCRNHGTSKLVIAGTICAYPKFAPVPFMEDDLWNGYPEETNAPYGIAKKTLLILAQAYRRQYGCNFVYVLPVNLYGPYDNFNLNSSHVIPAMLRKFHEAKVARLPSVTLWGDGSPTREFLYVDDCADAFVRTMESYNSPDPMNIGSGLEIPMRELALKIKAITQYDGDIIWNASMPNGQPRRCLDTSRARNNIGWESTTSLDAGLQRTYKWFVDSWKDTQNG